MTEADIGVIQQHVKEWWHCQKLEMIEYNRANTLISDLWPSELWKNTFISV